MNEFLVGKQLVSLRGVSPDRQDVSFPNLSQDFSYTSF